MISRGEVSRTLSERLDHLERADESKAAGYVKDFAYWRRSRASDYLIAGLCAALLGDPRTRTFFEDAAKEYLGCIYQPILSSPTGERLTPELDLMDSALLSGNKALSPQAANAFKDLRSQERWLPEEGHLAMVLAYLTTGRDAEGEERTLRLAAVAAKRKQLFFVTVPEALTAIRVGDSSATALAIQRVANHYRYHPDVPGSILRWACIPAMALRALARLRGVDCQFQHDLVPEIP